MISFEELKRSFLVSLWFVFLTFPLLVIKADPIERTVQWRWENMILVAIGSFTLSVLLRVFMIQKERRRAQIGGNNNNVNRDNIVQIILREPRYLYPLAGVLMVFTLLFPYLFSTPLCLL